MIENNPMTVGELIKDLQTYDPNLRLEFGVSGAYWDRYEYKLDHTKGASNMFMYLDGFWEDEQDE